MNQDFDPGFPGKLRWSCAACDVLDIEPRGPRVDPSGRSKDEADSLCLVHRARATEGYCVVCARGAVWAVLFPKSDIGRCRRCFVKKHGEKVARALELEWAREKKS